jgi:hypothetical protein
MVKRSILILAVLLVGCAAKPPELPELYYQGQLPVYVPSKLTDRMGSETGPGVGAISHEGMAWWLQTDDAPEKVMMFYDGKIRQHKQDKVDMEDSLAEYEWKPTGGEEGEGFEIAIRKGKDGKGTEIYLHESVKVGKRKKTD